MTDDEVVDAYVRASETGDSELLRQILAPGAVIWHNFDESERVMAASAEAAAAFHQRFADVRYDTYERHPIADGVVIRQVFHATERATGKPFTSHMAKFLRIRGGQLTRIDEYVAPSRVT
jgi:ketosteroid isomerase-like protein